jgi:DNA (cytosine-5)-methyltransferase 1
VPQNRERIFLVSIRDDGDLPRFFFPQPFPLKRRLKDVLEENVDEKYYLSDEMLERFQQ